MPESKVTVCDKCRRASCWQGVILCEEAQGAGTVDVPISVLAKEKRESPHYWQETLGESPMPELKPPEWDKPRDEAWMWAFVKALGSNSGLSAPICPEGVKMCLDQLVARHESEMTKALETIRHEAFGQKRIDLIVRLQNIDAVARKALDRARKENA